MSETFIVYVLYSRNFKRTYVGQTNNLEQRLERHNKGMVKSTRLFQPWDVAYHEQYRSRAEAMKREKWLKSGSGRDFIKKVFASV